jgi:arabinan endo-1,5-alpha-L-arabinosidase
MKQTYMNPVHHRSCPDPFVLKYLNEYWCYCTGFWHDGRVFGVLHSRDLLHWHELNGAMEPLDEQATCYWAPEVIYDNGRFWMYYSIGNEVRMQIRVAEAAHPAGPFIDKGVRLTKEDFAIDAHIFTEDDGTRWMFYATDFLSHSHIGTGTVCDEMLDNFTLAGNPRPVTRARYDWQVYDPQRQEKGGVRWYTVEGSFVLKHKGRYYQMFSSGNWQHDTYGVSYALSDHVRTETEWEQHADGEHVLPILRTVPGE